MRSLVWPQMEEVNPTALAESTPGSTESRPTDADGQPEKKDLRETLIAALKLPAEATDEEIGAALEALTNTPADELRPAVRKALKLGDDASDTDVTSALISAVEKLEGFETSAQQAREDELTAQLDEYEVDDEQRAILRDQLIADPEKATKLLSLIPKKKAAEPAAPAKSDAAAAAPTAPEKKTPPAPKHDPAAGATQLSEEERAQKISARAREIVKASGNKVSLTKAYQQAETELENAA